MVEPNLDDPEYAAFAWARYRRILGWMTAAAAAITAGCLVLLWVLTGGMTLVVMIGIALGFFLTMWLAAALMGLMFLSSGSGHDARVEDRVSGEIEID